MTDMKDVYALRKRITNIDNFDQADWIAIGDITDCQHIIEGHSRLFRSLSWGDPDYQSCVGEVLKSMNHENANSISAATDYLNEHFPEKGHVSVSTSPSKSRETIVFTPSVFDIPSVAINNNLVSIMMPFGGFDDVHNSIKTACSNAGFAFERADDIWENSTILQDIFSLIYRSSIVIVDFSNKNPNVMYEVGIAHTLGKIVIPISQSLEHIPSDLNGHRALIYLKNNEGLLNLSSQLSRKLVNTRNEIV